MTHLAHPMLHATGPVAFLTILRKDLRLVADGILPALALLSAFLLLTGGVLALPGSWRPDPIRDLSLAELLAIVAAALGIGSPILAGWWTAALLTGDRRHGARSLADSLPASRGARVAARGVVLLLVLIGPVLLASLVFQIAVLLDPQLLSTGMPVVPMWASLGLSTVGVITVGFATQQLPSLLPAQLAGHVGTLVALLVSFLTAWLTFSVTGAEILSVGRLSHDPGMADAIRLESSIVGAGVGALVAIGSVALAGVALVLRARSTTWMQRATLLALACAALTAALATPIIARRSALIATWAPWERRATIGATTDEVIRGVRASVAAYEERRGAAPRDQALFNEAITRLALAPRAEESSALRATFLELESNATRNDRWRIWTTHWRPSADPEYQSALVDMIIRAPDHSTLVDSIRLRLQQHRTLRWDRLPGMLKDEAPIKLARVLLALPEGTVDTEQRLRAIERLRAAWPDLDWSAIDAETPSESTVPE